MDKQRPIPTATDYARLAAYIDGEGNIGIQRNKSSWFFQITIVNTDPRLAVWLYDTFGGFINSRHHNHDRSAKWRSTLVWYITCGRAHELLEGCYPYLVTKADQADICLAFRKTVKRIGVKGHSKETINLRQSMRDNLKVLRHREYSKEELDEIADSSKSPRKVG